MSVVDRVLELIQLVRESSGRAEINQIRCKMLVEGLKTIEPHIEALQGPGSLLTTKTKRGLVFLEGELKNAKELIDGFSPRNWLGRLWSASDDEEKLAEVTVGINISLHTLPMSVDVDRLFSEDLSRKAAEADRAHFERLLMGMKNQVESEVKAGARDLKGDMALLRDILFQKPANAAPFPTASDSIRICMKEMREMILLLMKNQDGNALQPNRRPTGTASALHLIQVPYSQLTFLEKVGEGGFGIVYKGIYGGETVAIKKVHGGTLSPKAMDELLREAELHLRTRSKYIVQIQGVCTETPNVCLVLEWMERGSLFQLLHSSEPPPWNRRVEIAYQSALGMNKLHVSIPPIIHQDLKSHNILVDGAWQAKISDFGMSIARYETESQALSGSQIRGGTIQWMAPELLDTIGNSPSTQTDVYSFGVVMWELMTCKEPFADVHPQVILHGVQAGKRPPLIPNPEAPEGWVSLMTSCWAQEPGSRPSFDFVAKELQRILTAQGAGPKNPKRTSEPSSEVPLNGTGTPVTVYPEHDMHDPKMRRMRGESIGCASPKLLNLRIPRPSSIQGDSAPASPTNTRPKKEQESVNAQALFQLALAHKNGQNVAQDYVESFRLFRKAADVGHAAAQYNVGVCFANGQGVKKDYIEAVKWYRKAAEQDHTMAQSGLGYCYFTGSGVHVDNVEALKWFRKAAEKTDPRAEYYIAHSYQSGLGVPKDLAEALKWYGRAAEHGFPEAQYEYGNCFFNGWGTNLSYEEAVKWYSRASEQSYGPAQLQLAFCFQHGHGVPKNIEEARKLYEPHAKAGNQRAIRGLKRLS
eukprot:TRINITY_DN5659_c0_g2_i1.p1 TRINITY_DN5659_c0_g2~~TRINITY_DN5659_c0_g2_i1.p1  ORF type:complete len:812 (+),score=154.22 TRINITY_DN5659_c0_g2_i1:71-2506(+)